MEFSQSVEYNVRNIFLQFKKHAENEARRLVLGLFLFIKGHL